MVVLNGRGSRGEWDLGKGGTQKSEECYSLSASSSGLVALYMHLIDACKTMRMQGQVHLRSCVNSESDGVFLYVLPSLLGVKVSGLKGAVAV